MSTVQLELREDAPLSVDSRRLKLTPFVKWAGGKSSLFGSILPLVPRHLTNYYEPFLGGGAIFFGACGRGTKFKAFLSDTNSELIDTYKIIKSNPIDLVRSLSYLRSRYRVAEDKSAFYYRVRERTPKDSTSRAARFIFLNKTCYNGLYRVNPRGEFNVPFGNNMNPRIFDEGNIVRISKTLRETRARLSVVDYRDATASCKKGDFVYLDPPYHPSSETSSFTDYTPNGFGVTDQKQLAEEFKKLVNRECIVLLSNSNTPLIWELYARYRQRIVNVNRSINCIGDSRKGFRELIIVGSQK